MKRSDFIFGLEQALYDSRYCDGHDMEQVMKYIEKHMLPPYKAPPKLSVMEDEPKYTVYYKWENE